MERHADPQTPVVAFAGRVDSRGVWEAALSAAAARAAFDWRLEMDVDAVDPGDVEHLIYAPWEPSASSAPPPLSRFPKLRAIHNLWAGVEELLAQQDAPADVPLIRMVEPGLTEGMRDYCCGFALRALLDMDRLAAEDAAGRWAPVTPPLAREKRAGVLGLGELGKVVAEALAGLGFQTAGWSRSPKRIPGVADFCGAAQIDAFLERTDILIVLAPLTVETTGLLDATRLARLPDGAHVINAARGPLLVESALLEHIDRLGGATLDVFDVEPLPATHPYWSHPKILVTPHVASVTRPETAADSIVRDIALIRAGETPPGLVDRARGY